jgi:cytochrome P450
LSGYPSSSPLHGEFERAPLSASSAAGLTDISTVRLFDTPVQSASRSSAISTSRRRTHPKPDLLSTFAAAEEHGAALSDEELLWNCVLLLIAGHETVMDLVGNGLLALLRHSGELQKLHADRSIIPAAVEELLRYDAPFQFMQRQARQNVEIGGVPIRAGERVWLMLGAANRDPAVFPDQDRLDVTRSYHRQIAFGLGIHFYIGAPLARLEGQIGFTALVRRFAEISLATAALEWLPKLPNRGLKALPVTFRVSGR